MITNLDAHLSEFALLGDSSWSDGNDCSPVNLLLRLEDDSSLGNFLAIWLLDNNPVQKWSDFLESEAHI